MAVRAGASSCCQPARVPRAVASAEYWLLLRYPHAPALLLLDNSWSTRTAWIVVFMPSSIGQVGDTAKNADFEIQILKRAVPRGEIRIRPDRSYQVAARSLVLESVQRGNPHVLLGHSIHNRPQRLNDQRRCDIVARNIAGHGMTHEQARLIARCSKLSKSGPEGMAQPVRGPCALRIVLHADDVLPVSPVRGKDPIGWRNILTIPVGEEQPRQLVAHRHRVRPVTFDHKEK